MSDLNNIVKWELIYPLSIYSETEQILWINELSTMRAKVFYDNGKRPAFKTANDKYVDDDGLDKFCYHIIARINDEIIGCIRLLPLFNSAMSVTKSILNDEQYDAIIKVCTRPHFKLLEGSRLVVNPQYQGRNLAIQLVSGCYALARKLKANFIASVGTCTEQDKFLRACGGDTIVGFEEKIFSKQFNDNVIFLFFNADEPSKLIKAYINKMETRLKLNEIEDKVYDPIF